MKCNWLLATNASSRLVGIVLLCAGCAAGAAPSGGSLAPTAAPAAASATTVVVASGPQMTLPQFLGVCQVLDGAKLACNRLRNRLGTRFPGLESKPPLLAITDPANLDPSAPPAVQAAAEVKAEEDKAPQKIKALNYLASVGCSKCYPDVEQAFLLALDDCTASVRLAAAKGIRQLGGGACGCCEFGQCCTQPIVEKLQKLAYERDGWGCYVEPSAEVRRQARLALGRCSGPILAEEQPSDDVAAEGPPAPAAPAPTTPAKGGS